MGSSINQNKHVVFYAAVLNGCKSVSWFDGYLKHPLLEPDYRKDRNHKDFVTSIALEKYNININEIRKAVEKEFQHVVYGRTKYLKYSSILIKYVIKFMGNHI